MDKKNQMMLNYPGGITRYNPMSFLEVIDTYKSDSHADKLKNMKDAAIFVGLTATGTVDLRPTPFSPLFPMVGVVAATFANIVDGTFITASSHLADFLMVFLLGMIITAFSPRFSSTKGAIFSASLVIIWCVIAYFLFLKKIMVPIFYPVSAALFSYLGIIIYVNSYIFGVINKDEGIMLCDLYFSLF